MSRFQGPVRWSCRLAITIVIGVGVLAQARAARAQSFMGCSLREFPDQILSCLNGKLDESTRDWQRKLDDTKRDGEARLHDAQAKAEARIRDAVDKLQRDLDAAGRLIRTDVERGLLDAERTLHLEPLVACVARANPAAEVSGLARRMAADPQAFLKAAYDDAAAVVAPDAALIVPSLTGRVRPPSPAEIAAATWARLERLAQRSPTLRCMVDYLRPSQPAMQGAFAELAPRFSTMVSGAWSATGESVLAQAMAKLISAGLSRTALGDDGVLVLKGALTERLLGPDRIGHSADAVHQLAAAIPQGGAALAEAARQARDALTTGVQIDSDFYVDLFGAWLKVAGHKLIRSDRPPGPGLPGGGWVADRLLDQLDWLPGAINAVIGSACGLAPEAGGALCAWAVQLNLRELWVSNVRPLIKDTALAALELAFDKSADLLKERLRGAARTGRDRLRRDLGPFGPALEGLSQQLVTGFVDDVVKATREALARYDHSVVELVDASTAGR